MQFPYSNIKIVGKKRSSSRHKKPEKRPKEIDFLKLKELVNHTVIIKELPSYGEEIVFRVSPEKKDGNYVTILEVGYIDDACMRRTLNVLRCVYYDETPFVLHTADMGEIYEYIDAVSKWYEEMLADKYKQHGLLK